MGLSAIFPPRLVKNVPGFLRVSGFSVPVFERLACPMTDLVGVFPKLFSVLVLFKPTEHYARFQHVNSYKVFLVK